MIVPSIDIQSRLNPLSFSILFSARRLHLSRPQPASLLALIRGSIAPFLLGPGRSQYPSHLCLLRLLLRVENSKVPDNNYSSLSEFRKTESRVRKPGREIALGRAIDDGGGGRGSLNQARGKRAAGQGGRRNTPWNVTV